MPRKQNRSSSSARKNQPWWHIRNVFKNLDMFGKEVPAFNISGEQRVNTAIGGVFSTFIVVTAITYGTIKLS